MGMLQIVKTDGAISDINLPLSRGNFAEIKAELCLDERTTEFEPAALRNKIDAYAKAKGYFDREDWLDTALHSIAATCACAEELGDAKIRYAI